MVVIVAWVVLVVGNFRVMTLQLMSFDVGLRFFCWVGACNGSAMTTIMMNRVGDFALMVMMVTLSSLGLVMFMGAIIAKRAQVPMSR
ncbi:hypothetical protein T4D_7865 [Trichinella pseudospiralis]|uniref:Uncharacterized protein n=1 Tax=Trichinella pseudospiralis TaxID=6337 RepID=A0A0V1F603_TRIPS|nr:hypothetical protein T4D_11716 [Trichinella pseudospiralis]KRY81365.1 hypothetical protein T4D_7865 [Trichinella pseudospiralis]